MIIVKIFHFIEYFYFDVLSSIKEFKIAIESIKEFNKPYLIGAHISEGTKLPSGENISEITTKIKHKNLLGIMLSCISPENYELNLDEIKNLGIPFGFKLNAYIKTNYFYSHMFFIFYEYTHKVVNLAVFVWNPTMRIR